MNVQIHSKGVNLNETAKAHIEAAVEGFRKFQLDITTVNINVASEKKGVEIEFDIHIGHSQPVVISQGDSDLDTAIDMAIERTSKALRRLHDKIVDKHAVSVKDLETLEV